MACHRQGAATRIAAAPLEPFALKVRIATRRSQLALWQARHVAEALRRLDGSLQVELLELTTTGDRITDRPLLAVGGKGLFVREIEQALIDGRAELAVHSMKDLPAQAPAGLAIGAMLERADPRDCLVAGAGGGLDALPAGARVGTSSLRRRCQLERLRGDLEYVPLRGNVDTRLRRVSEGAVDAAVLACAGLERLGLAARITERLEVRRVVPAPGQGAIGVQHRPGNAALDRLLARLDHGPTRCRVAAERSLAAALGGGCHLPLGAHAVLDGGRLHLDAVVVDPDDGKVVRADATGVAADPQALGRALAQRLRELGAGTILERVAGAHDG